MTQIWKLPMPPGTNALYRNVPGKGRVKTARYKAWAQEAGRLCLTQGPRKLTPGYVMLIIRLATPNEADARIDADNVKAIPDLLKTLGLIEDDRFVASIFTSWVADERGVAVAIAPVANPWQDDAPHA